MERPDQRKPRPLSGDPPDQRSHRLVDVDNVVAAGAELLEHRAEPEGRDCEV